MAGTDAQLQPSGRDVLYGACLLVIASGWREYEMAIAVPSLMRSVWAPTTASEVRLSGPRPLVSQRVPTPAASARWAIATSSGTLVLLTWTPWTGMGLR